MGKGLKALIPEGPSLGEKKGPSGFEEIEIGKIKLNPHQPRESFPKEEIDELKTSIQNEGLLQPIIVAKGGEGYTLIAGERRLRAVKELGWRRIPAIVLEDISDAELLRKSLVENIQRRDLNPIEEALAYKKLIDVFGYSVEKVAREVGKDFSTIFNAIRLLNLPPQIQEDLKRGKITAGHARAILMLKGESQMIEFAEEIKRKRMSVREAERRARERRQVDPNMRQVIEELQRKFGTKVDIVRKRKGGKIEIAFIDEEDLNRIIKILLAGEV